MFIELVKGVALMLALCFLHGLSIRVLRHRPITCQITLGLIFGVTCIVGMLLPFVVVPGVFFDVRSMALSMAGLFGGPIVTGIALLMAASWRIMVGGVGTEVGVLGMVVSAALGLAYRWGHQRGLVRIRLAPLMLFGLLVHLALLVVFQLLPTAATDRINHALLLPYLAIFVLSTPAMGYLLMDLENRVQTEHRLAQTAARLHAITQAIPDVLLVLDRHGRYMEVLSSNGSALAMPAQRLIGKHLHDILPLAEARLLLQSIETTLRNQRSETMEYTLETLSGPRVFEGRTQPLNEPVHGQAAVVFLARDITERKQTEQALRESELRFRSLLLNIPAISVQGYLADGTTSYWNKASEQLYGYTAEEALGRSLFDLIIPPNQRNSARREVTRMFTTGEAGLTSELKLQRKDGSLVDVFSSHAYIQVPGQPPEIFSIDIDISGRKAAEQEARRLASYDSLTHLPNRRMLMSRLKQVLANGIRNGLCAAVLFIDLDNFKTLNDTQGHEMGDKLLVEVAQRLRQGVREHDTVARLGGDEFVVVLQDLSANPQEASTQTRTRGELLLARLAQSYDLSGYEHYCSASIGATVLTPSQVSVEEVLKQADMAMYRSKAAGRNALSFFDPDMQRALNRRAEMEAELHQGLRQGQFQLFYQPQVDAQGRWIGAEALVRWNHPRQGLVPPSEFIPLAEETGLILPLGQWVIETALRQQALWQRDPALAHLQIAINVNARQFHQEDFVQHIHAQLQSTGADPHHIKLELTESLLLDHVEGVIHTFGTLKADGFGFALDDFGTGYSSLTYLQRLPLDQIKIDQSFVRSALVNPSAAAIARSLIALGKSLDISVIAEGVETEAHYQYLLQYKCPAFQGNWFGEPLMPDEFERRARAQPPRYSV